jgi:hypothetical protein
VASGPVVKLVVESPIAAEPEQTAKPYSGWTDVVSPASADPGVEALLAPPPETADGLFSGTFKLDGRAYKLPMKVSKLEQNGWICTDDALEQTVSPFDLSEPVELMNDYGHYIVVLLMNASTQDQKAKNCNVSIVAFSPFDAVTGTEFYLPKGITLVSSYDDVIEAYGKPSSVEEDDELLTLNYESNAFSNVLIGINKEYNDVASIAMCNYVSDDDPENDNAMPSYVADYNAPKELEDNWDSFTFTLAGDYYRLPIPVSELQKNGWVIASNADEPVNVRDFEYLKLQKDGWTFYSVVENYADFVQPLKNCYSVYFEYRAVGGEIEIVLPKGLTEKSSIEDFKSAYGSPAASYNTSSNYREIVFRSGSKGLKIVENISKKSILEIHLMFLSDLMEIPDEEDE